MADGKIYYDAIISNDIFKSHPDVRIYAFIERMDLAYNVADIVVSRAGAIAISELCITGKPAILIPSPNVAEDHQTKNAQALVHKNAAILLPDAEAKENLFQTLLSLAGDKERQNQLIGNISSLAIPDAAQRIAEEALNIIKQRN